MEAGNVPQGSMRKTIGIIIVVVAVIILLILLMGRGEDKTPTGQENVASESSNPAPQNESSFSGTFQELAMRGGDYMCTFDSGAAGGNVSGTMYVSGKNIRGTFKTTGAGAVESNMVMDGNYSYVWTSAYPQGFKTKIDQTASTQTSASSGQNSVDANAKYDYKCQSSKVDAAMFTLPMNIVFNETPMR